MSKYVFITGGTKGIGKAVAECLAKSGYHLILTYSADQKTAVNTRQELQAKYGNSVSVIQADNSNLQAIDTIASYLAEKVYARRGEDRKGEMRSLIRPQLTDMRSWYMSWRGQIGY